jgi:hypothetical protein
MVNGHRPTQLYLGSSPHSSAFHTPQSHTTRTVATNHVTTPTLLQRQATSIYSTCSNETPVLVCAKKATPVAGSWSEEPWTPSHMAPRATLADLLETQNREEEDIDSEAEDVQLRDCDQETTASFADTAVFGEHQRRASAPAKLEPTVIAVAVPTHAASTTDSPAAHVSVVYRHEPYAFASPRREIFRCQCDACFEAGVDCTGHDFLTYGSGTAAMFPSARSDEGRHLPSYPPEEHEMGYDEPSFGSYEAAFYGEASALSQPPSHHDRRIAPREEGFHASMPHHEAAPLSAFMPPPPPPKITRGVMAESAEPTLDVDAAFYHIALRWYGKVAKVQTKFVALDELCPEPNRDGQSFPEWVEEVGKWWLEHFEHLQKKTSISSGLLRSAIAPAGCSRVAPTGFETHASIAASYAAHKFALKTGPRRTAGSSGLTAEMLQSHLETMPPKAPGLPTPRSKQTPRGQTADDLPW